MENTSQKKGTQPRINPQVDLSKLSVQEGQIVRKLSLKYWYVTRCQQTKKGAYTYKVVFIKPTDYIQQCFNLIREVVVIFSPYEHFEPRTFDVLDDLNVQELRLEEICSIVISKDKDVASVISTILKSNVESRILIPFTYDELSIKDIDDVVVNTMRKFFYSRDLFDIQDPLKKELYFFGRTELIHVLANKHQLGENSGIFGLRKTGKTSILYGVERTLSRKQSIVVLIDCQTLHNKPWNLALHGVIREVVLQGQFKQSIIDKNKESYDNPSTVTDVFENDIKYILSHNGKRSILLVFDEIENISFGTSVSSNWKNGTDFIKFWQVIRSTYQKIKNKNNFSYLIAGTNPCCVEKPIIAQIDNPIFQQFTPIYIEPFQLDQTYEMINRLGGYMGLRFTKEVCTHINEDFGGHPLLIRQICSYIHKNTKTDRPIEIGTHEYYEHKRNFYKDSAGFSKYAEMILEVLKTWYEDEYQMLKWLAAEDYTSFSELVSGNDVFIKHLKQYGIIEEDGTSMQYHFKIEAIKDYLSTKFKYDKLGLSKTQMHEEIKERLTWIEKELKRIVQIILRSQLGETQAMVIMKRVTSIQPNAKPCYKDFFCTQILLADLIDIIIDQYPLFKHTFSSEIETFKAHSTILRNYTIKSDVNISKSDFMSFRGSATWFEEALREF